MSKNSSNLGWEKKLILSLKNKMRLNCFYFPSIPYIASTKMHKCETCFINFNKKMKLQIDIILIIFASEVEVEVALQRSTRRGIRRGREQGWHISPQAHLT